MNRISGTFLLITALVSAGALADTLELTDVEIGGELQPIVSGDFRLVGGSQGTLRNTAFGAVLGALIDGSDGAKKGALAGFGASLLIPGKQVEIPAGTRIEFRLSHSFTTEASVARR